MDEELTKVNMLKGELVVVERQGIKNYRVPRSRGWKQRGNGKSWTVLKVYIPRVIFIFNNPEIDHQIRGAF